VRTPAEQFGINLKRCRRRVRLSQEAVAVRASLHRTEIGYLENGKRSPRIDTLIKLCGAIEATPADLLDGIEWLPGQDHDGRFSIPDGR
jgi:transcriptional regulator with XRE-family HTH domain